LIQYTVLQEFHHPVMVDVVKETSYVGI
jgi:hypothetical protein